MPTVLDSLVLEFNLDTSQFTKEQQRLMDQIKRLEEETKTRATNLEGRFKQMSNLFSNLQRGALATVGAFFGGEVVSMIANFNNLEARISRVGEVINMSSQRTLAWKAAFEGLGEDAEAGLRALMQTSGIIGQAIFTGDVNNPLFRGVAALGRPGMQPLDLLHGGTGTGGRMTPEEAMVAIAQRMDELGLQKEDRAAAIQFMGLPMFMMMQSAEVLRKMVADVEKVGPMTEEEGRRARQFQEDTNILTQSFRTLGRIITHELTPSLTALAQWLTAFIPTFNKEDPSGMAGWAQGLGAGAANRWFRSTPLGKRFAPGGDLAPAPAPAPASAPETGGNMDRFLGALSYLETDQKDIGNATTSAQGFFQFLSGTAKMARVYGIEDQRYGTYEQQAGRTRQYIERRYPAAAEAIERGDWATAERLLYGEWPSLPHPGGSQQQTPSRYRRYHEMLQGGAPSRTSNNHVSFNIQNMNVNGSNAHEVATNIGRNAERIKMAYYGNSAAV